MSWRNQGITGSNNIPLGKVRRFGGDADNSNASGDYDRSNDRGDRGDRHDYRSDRGNDRNGGGGYGDSRGGYDDRRDRDRDLKRGRSPEPRAHAGAGGADPSGPRQRKKRNRWGDASDNKAAGLMGLPTAILAKMTSEQLEAYTLHLRIEEITQKLKIDDVVPADGDRSPSPAPQYDNHGRRINTREYRYRKKLEEERHKLVEKAIKTFPNYHPPQDYRRPTKTQEKVYVPVNDYPEINFSMIANPSNASLTAVPAVSCSFPFFSFLSSPFRTLSPLSPLSLLPHLFLVALASDLSLWATLPGPTMSTQDQCRLFLSHYGN